MSDELKPGDEIVYTVTGVRAPNRGELFWHDDIKEALTALFDGVESCRAPILTRSVRRAGDWRAKCVVWRPWHSYYWDVESPDGKWYLTNTGWYEQTEKSREHGVWSMESSARTALATAPPPPGCETTLVAPPLIAGAAAQSMADHPHGVRFLGPEGECLLCKVEVLTQDRDAAQRRYEALSYRHFTCNGCGRSWNCEPQAKDAHGQLQASLPCPWCNPPDPLRALLLDPPIVMLEDFVDPWYRAVGLCVSFDSMRSILRLAAEWQPKPAIETPEQIAERIADRSYAQSEADGFAVGWRAPLVVAIAAAIRAERERGKP